MSDILDSKGKTSSMRAMMILVVISGCVVAIGTSVGSVMGTPIDSNVPWLVGTLLSAGFGGKVAQKFTEK